jgi:hypothetical protein
MVRPIPSNLQILQGQGLSPRDRVDCALVPSCSPVISAAAADRGTTGSMQTSVAPEGIRSFVPPHPVAGVTMKPGDLAIISPWVLHRHQRRWHEPDAFAQNAFCPAPRQSTAWPICLLVSAPACALVRTSPSRRPLWCWLSSCAHSKLN